jgi:hypothetical protein
MSGSTITTTVVSAPRPGTEWFVSEDRQKYGYSCLLRLIDFLSIILMPTFLIAFRRFCVLLSRRRGISWGF